MKIYVVMGLGSYDETDWMVKGFLNKDMAEKFEKECAKYSSNPPAIVDKAYSTCFNLSEEEWDIYTKEDYHWKHNGPDKNNYLQPKTVYCIRELEVE